MNTFDILKRGINFSKSLLPPKLTESQKIAPEPENTQNIASDFVLREKSLDKKISKCLDMLNSASPLKEEKKEALQKIYSQLSDKKSELVFLLKSHIL